MQILDDPISGTASYILYLGRFSLTSFIFSFLTLFLTGCLSDDSYAVDDLLKHCGKGRKCSKKSFNWMFSKLMAEDDNVSKQCSAYISFSL